MAKERLKDVVINHVMGEKANKRLLVTEECRKCIVDNFEEMLNLYFKEGIRWDNEKVMYSCKPPNSDASLYQEALKRTDFEICGKSEGETSTWMYLKIRKNAKGNEAKKVLELNRKLDDSELKAKAVSLLILISVRDKISKLEYEQEESSDGLIIHVDCYPTMVKHNTKYENKLIFDNLTKVFDEEGLKLKSIEESSISLKV